MAVRAVPRFAVLFSWFLAFALLVMIGIALGSVGAWLAAIKVEDKNARLKAVEAHINRRCGGTTTCFRSGRIRRAMPSMAISTA